MMRPEAVIFDLDGVIADTAYLHFLAWREMAAGIGIALNESVNAQLKGVSRGESLERILRVGGKAHLFNDEQRRVLTESKNARYVKSLASLNRDALLPGIGTLLNDIRRAGVKVGLASASHNAPAILRALGMASAFDFCADPARITHSKPDPEIFLMACHGLNVSPCKSIGVEDAQAGIEAINAAGMLSVGIGEGLQHAGLLLSTTSELTWQGLSDFWAASNNVKSYC